jgi:hypothetical protein
LHLIDLLLACLCSQELTERTGKNPQYQYVQVGCSKKAEMAMLHFARQQVGKPFSSSGMARALLWPRESDGKSWYVLLLNSFLSNPISTHSTPDRDSTRIQRH